MFSLAPAVLEKIAATFHIPPRPEVLKKLDEIKKNGDTDILAIANIVKQDPGLASIVLHSVNTPLFGAKQKISDISHAVILLGFDTLYTVVTACLLQKSFGDSACISLQRFWDESVQTAHFCKYIGFETQFADDIACLYTLGLFHDSGIAAMAIKYPDYRDTLELTNQDNSINIVKVEFESHQITHTEVGYAICKTWELPDIICQAVSSHHNSSVLNGDAPYDLKLLSANLRIALNIQRQVRYQQDEYAWQDVKGSVFDILEIQESTYNTLLSELRLLTKSTSNMKS